MQLARTRRRSRRWRGRTRWRFNWGASPCWLRQSMICLAILGLALFSASNTGDLAGYFARGFDYVLNCETDLAALWEKARTVAVFRSGSGWPWSALSADDETMVLPVFGTLTSGYGWRLAPGSNQQQFHTGIDLAVAEGTPIKAALSGRVAEVSEDSSYGKKVVIDHGSGLSTVYGHCSEILVAKGDRVTQGQVIARVGKTGNATEAHLHFEIIRQGNPVDPAEMIDLRTGN